MIFQKIPNIFLLANSFAKGKMLGADWHPTGPSGENNCNFYWCLANSNVREIRLYFEFTTANRMSGKNLRAEIFRPKVDEDGYF